MNCRQTRAGSWGRFDPWVLFLMAAWIVSCAAQVRGEGNEERKEMKMFEMTSTAFESGKEIPAKYTRDGADISPPLRWTNAPEGTKTFVLIADDPDAPAGTWVHWVVYDIPAGCTEIRADVPDEKLVLNGAKQGANDFRKVGYDGPSPPPGRPHRYVFSLYAVSRETGLPPAASKAQVLHAIKDSILAETQLVGKYKR